MERFIRKNMENLDIFLGFFEELNKFSIFAQNIGLAFGAILIPIAIAIFRDKNFETLDTNVILDRVINGKKLITYLGIILLIPFLWYITNNVFINSIGLLLWLFGIYIILRILGDCYKWIKGHKMNLRFNYLKALKNIQDMEESWHSVWQTPNINIQNENEFFKIFSPTIDQLLKSPKKNPKITAKLLNDFYNFINNRSIFFLAVIKEIFPKLLEWHFKIWQEEYKRLDKEDKLDEWINYVEMSRIMDSILNNIEERSLKEKKFFSFFNYFKTHVESYKKEFIKIDNEEYCYAESLFNIFYPVFFKNIAKLQARYKIWKHYFPKEWKITKKNLEDKENVMSKISLNMFSEWAQERIRQVQATPDWDLDEVSRNLFPELNPRLWAIILIFIYMPYDNNIVKSVIDRSWNFGFIGRVSRLYPGDIADKEEESKRKTIKMVQSAEKVEIKNTFELTYLLFKDQFSKENLEKYIKSLKELKYEKEPKKENKRLRLLNTFKEMLKFLSEQNDNII